MTERAVTALRTGAGVPVGRRRLRRTLVQDVMTAAVESVRPYAVFEDVARVLRVNGVRAVPVLDADNHLLGVISGADLMRTTQLGDPRWPSPAGHQGGNTGTESRPRIAQDLMTSPVVSVSPTASVAEAARLMREHKLGWLAVVEGTDIAAAQLVGVLDRRDLLTVFARDDDELRQEIMDSLPVLADPAHVEVGVNHGVVTLSGHLPTAADLQLVSEFVERLEGVVAVTRLLTSDDLDATDPSTRQPR
jgi:CBS domain-containing protein